MRQAQELYETLRFLLWTHPISSRNKVATTLRWLRWQIGGRVVQGDVVVPFVGPSKLLMRPGMKGATGNLYSGLHEFEDMSFLLHLLREGDTFVDVGANVGSFTILASRVRGAKSIAIEPLPATFRDLQTNIDLNELRGLVDALNIGIGRERSTLAFTTGHGPMNHAATEEERRNEAVAEVPVRTLDEALGGRSPTLIKIDVEGLEADVLAGGERALAAPSLIAVTMELLGFGERYGHDERSLHTSMLDRGFTPCTYAPLERRLTPMSAKNDDLNNTIYVRDIERARERLTNGPSVDVLGVTV